LGEIRISGMPPLTKLTFAVEPPFTAISSHEIAAMFFDSYMDADASGVVTGQICVVEDNGGAAGATRMFGSLDTKWRLIQLAGAVNFLLTHPRAREVYLLTTMRLSREYTR